MICPLPCYLRLACLTWLLVVAAESKISGDERLEVAPLAPGMPGTGELLTDTSGLSALTTRLLREHLPTTYENNKQWGGTTRLWDGLKVSFDDGRIKTKRRWKEVNHGTWKTYRAWLIDPEKELHVEFHELRELAPGRVGVDLWATARLGAFARLAEWQRGVQLLSISADAEAKVRLQVQAELTTRLQWRQFTPELVLDVQATGADLRLQDFRLIRVSDLHGPVVRELGDNLRGVLQKELDDRRPKLVESINKQLARHQDELRLGLPGLSRKDDPQDGGRRDLK